MVEARREGPEPLNIVIKIFKNKTNQITEETVEKSFRTSGSRILGTSQGEYHPQL
jgi:hypothetical protein